MACGPDSSSPHTRQANELVEVIEVIDLIFDFTVHPHQKRRLWRHQSLGITAPEGEDRESPGLCMRTADVPQGGVGIARGVHVSEADSSRDSDAASITLPRIRMSFQGNEIHTHSSRKS